MAKSAPLGEAGEYALRLVEDSQSFHDSLVDGCDSRWRAFEGALEKTKDSASWQSQLHPPYLNHIVETQLAGLMDDRFSFQVRPMPKFFNAGEYDKYKQGAKAHEDLFRHQLKQDRFNEFQRPYALDAAVCGIGVASTIWRSETEKRKRKVFENAAAKYPSIAALGLNLPVPKTVERVETVFDGPLTESLDPRDCYWHEAATSLEKSRFFAYSVWMSYADMMTEAKAGRFDMDAVKSLESATEQGSVQDSAYSDNRRKRGRRKDMIEALWVWDREKRRVTVIGGRKALLRDKEWPYWHGQYPFTIVSLQPYPRALKGMSVVEKLSHLQEAVWDLMNQRIDNVRFLNNFISILRSDVDDPDAFPFEPGAVWFMDDPQSAQQFAPNPLPAEISISAESIIKTDMQNLAGGSPFTSNSEAARVGADTATEAALVTNLAQLMTKQMKQRLYDAYERIGQQRVWLNQQFIDEPIYVDKLGLDSAQEVREILPFLLEGDYCFDVQAMNESLNRAERRSEATGRFQIFMQAAPILVAAQVPLNFKALVEDVLDAYDVEDKDRYFSAQPVQPAQPQGQPGQPGQPQQGGPQGPGGVTAPQSIDPATSPSNQASISPSVFQARALASQGGANNG